jgi:hypothetical protein
MKQPSFVVRLAIVFLSILKLLQSSQEHLPSGWTKHIWEGKTYYYHQQSGISQWEPPIGTSPASYADQKPKQQQAAHQSHDALWSSSSPVRPSFRHRRPSIQRRRAAEQSSQEIKDPMTLSGEAHQHSGPIASQATVSEAKVDEAQTSAQAVEGAHGNDSGDLVVDEYEPRNEVKLESGQIEVTDTPVLDVDHHEREIDEPKATTEKESDKSQTLTHEEKVASTFADDIETVDKKDGNSDNATEDSVESHEGHKISDATGPQQEPKVVVQSSVDASSHHEQPIRHQSDDHKGNIHSQQRQPQFQHVHHSSPVDYPQQYNQQQHQYYQQQQQQQHNYNHHHHQPGYHEHQTPQAHAYPQEQSHQQTFENMSGESNRHPQPQPQWAQHPHPQQLQSQQQQTQQTQQTDKHHQQLKEVVIQLKEADKQIDELNKMIDDLEAERDELKGRLDGEIEEKSKLQASYNASLETQTELSDKIDSLEDQLASLNEQLSAAESDKQAAEDLLEELKTKSAGDTAELKELHANFTTQGVELQEAKMKLQEQEKELADAYKEIGTLEQDLKNVAEPSLKRLKQPSFFSRMMEAMNPFHSWSTSGGKSSIAANSKHSRRAKGRAAAAEALADSLSSMNRTILDLRENLTAMATALESKEELIEELSGQLEEYQEEAEKRCYSCTYARTYF